MIRPRNAIQSGAFTLLEVLLAVLLLAAVVTVIYFTWSTGLQGWKGVTEASDDLQKTRAILDGVAEMLRSAVSYDQSAGADENEDLYLFEGIHGTYGENDADSVNFVTLSSRFLRPYEMERMPLRRVRISLEQDQDRRPYLAMFSSSALRPADSEEPAPVKLAEDVIGFRVRYYDADIDDWQEDWVDELGMPSQAEITLTYRPAAEGGAPIVQRMVTGIPAREAAEEQSTQPVQPAGMQRLPGTPGR